MSDKNSVIKTGADMPMQSMVDLLVSDRDAALNQYRSIDSKGPLFYIPTQDLKADANADEGIAYYKSRLMNLAAMTHPYSQADEAAAKAGSAIDDALQKARQMTDYPLVGTVLGLVSPDVIIGQAFDCNLDAGDPKPQQVVLKLPLTRAPSK